MLSASNLKLILPVPYAFSLHQGAWGLFVWSHWYTWAEFVVPYYICLGSKLFLDGVLNVFIVYLFCSNIIKLTVRTRKSLVSLSAEMYKCQDTGVSFRHGHALRFFKTMVKYFILCCFTVTSTVMFTVSELILSVAIEYAGYTENYSFYRTWYCVYFTLCFVDAVMSSLFVLLSFSFTHRWYTKCCRCLDGWCLTLWKRASVPKDEEHHAHADIQCADIQCTDLKVGQSTLSTEGQEVSKPNNICHVVQITVSDMTELKDILETLNRNFSDGLGEEIVS